MTAVAQQENSYETIDRKMLAISEEKTSSVDAIASYINTTFSSDDEKVRAIYVWLAHTMDYDVVEMRRGTKNYSENELEQMLKRALKDKKGVCFHYSYLFKEIGDRVGIRSHLVQGYTRTDRSVMELSHQWCAAEIGSVWYLFDPTWGAGHVQKDTFVKRFNESYYKVPAEKMIRTHMPFDPMWQLLDYPYTYKEFDTKLDSVPATRPYVNWQDSMAVYTTQSELEQLVSQNKRIEANGAHNSLVKNHLLLIRKNISVYHTNQMIEVYNQATDLYNKGVNEFNYFVVYRNNQFTPELPEKEVRKMLSDCEASLLESLELLGTVVSSDKQFSSSATDLKRTACSLLENLAEHQLFVDKYFSTKKAFRKILFYKSIL